MPIPDWRRVRAEMQAERIKWLRGQIRNGSAPWRPYEQLRREAADYAAESCRSARERTE